MNPQAFSLVTNKLEERTPAGLIIRLDQERLWKCIQEVMCMNSIKKLFIVIDAIEELGFGAALSVITNFWTTIAILNEQYPEHRIKILMSSRNNPDYQRSLPSMVFLRLPKLETKRSIRVYLDDSIRAFAYENPEFEDATTYQNRLSIAEEIAKRADGMFLWARIAWEDFRRGLL
jgi:hypothetical protein